MSTRREDLPLFVTARAGGLSHGTDLIGIPEQILGASRAPKIPTEAPSVIINPRR